MTDDNGISADERRLFREAVGDVTPLADDRAEPSKPRPTPEPRLRRADDRQVLEELLRPDHDPADLETGEELLFLRSGVQHRVLRKLRRGHYSVADEIDLHNRNAEAAKTALSRFIDSAQRRGLTCVKVIHGKGLRSRARGPVIKRVTDHALRRNKAVLAFASAKPEDGGTGAVYVLLRRG